MARRSDEQEKLIAAQQATIEQLNALVTDLRAMLEQMRAREAELSAKLDAVLRKAFGKSSEKMPTPAKELRKERSAELTAALGQQKRKHNEERKAALETEVVEHTVPDDKRACPKCASTDMTAATPHERVDYGYVPGYFRRRVHRQEVLVCPCCATRVTAEPPPRPFEKVLTRPVSSRTWSSRSVLVRCPSTASRSSSSGSASRSPAAL